MELEELVARERIRDTIARYNHAGDRGRLDELSACFTEDGVLEIRDEAPIAGRAAIRRSLTEVVTRLEVATERPLLRHHVSSVRVELEGPDRARAASYFLAITEVGPDHWGLYLDRFARVGGAWLIAHRRVRVDGAAPSSRMVR